jgi:hypothetical protein
MVYLFPPQKSPHPCEVWALPGGDGSRIKSGVTVGGPGFTLMTRKAHLRCHPALDAGSMFSGVLRHAAEKLIG